jgi:chromosome segregation ATPase
LESDYATEVLDEVRERLLSKPCLSLIHNVLCKLKPTAVDWHPIVESTRPVATFHYPTCAATPFPYAERIVAPPRVETVYVHDGVSVLWFIPITIAFAALSVMLYKKWTLLKSAVEVLSWTWQLSDKVHGEDKKRIADADATSLLQLAQIDALQVLLTQEKKEVVAKHEIIVGKMGKIERLETQLHQAELEARNDVQQVELARLRRAEVEKDAGLARSNARMETLQQTIEMHKALLAVSDKKEEVMKAEKANLEQTKTNLERKADILDKALSFSRGQLKESESECLSLRESVERTTNELRSTESELKQHAEREIELASELDEARKQLQAKDRRIGDLTTSSMQSRKAVDTLEDKLSQSLTKVQTLDLELQKAKLSQDGAAKDIEELSLRLEQQLRAMEEARMERDHAYAEKDDADRSRDEAIRERDEATHGRDEAIRDRDELTYQMEEVRQNVELILCEQEKRKIELAEAASQIQSSVSQLNEEQSRSKTLQQENELIKQLLTEAGSQLEAAQAKIKDHERFEVSMFDVAFSLVRFISASLV